MSASLASEIKRFCNHSKRLKAILDETKGCFSDIQKNGRNENGAQILPLETLKEEESDILSMTHKHPGIVILGQNEYCKSKVANEIFGRTLFPSFELEDETTRYRTVRFKFGENLSINLELPNDYSLVEHLEAYKGPWNTIPHKDLVIADNEEATSAIGSAVLEVSINHQILRNGCKLVVSATNVSFEDEMKKCTDDISPILIYAFHTDRLSTKQIRDLELLKDITQFQPVCFVRVPSPPVTTSVVSGTPFGFHVAGAGAKRPSPHSSVESTDILSNGYVPHHSSATSKKTTQNGSPVPGGSMDSQTHTDKDYTGAKQTTGGSHANDPHSGLPCNRQGKVFSMSIPPATCQIVFGQLCKVGYLTDTPGVRNISQNMVEDYFTIESILVPEFDTFLQSFMSFSEQTMQRYLVNAVIVLNHTHIRCLQTFIICAFDMARDVLVTPKKIEFARDKEEELYKSLFQIAVDKGDEIQKMIENTLDECKSKLIDKAYEYDFIGVEFTEKGEIITNKGLKICTGQIQELVLGGLNQAVAGKLVSSVDILRDSYTGTLTRCLESLEKVEQEHPDNNSTTEALKQILNAAYQVEITVRSSSNIMHVFLQRMKQLVQGMLWSQNPKIDDEWKKRVAAEMLENLSATRLAKSISSQIKERLTKSHEAFQTALRQLEMKHGGRLDKIEDDRLKLRKVYAPRVAKVALESTSLKDLIMHGMPHMGREIGRGQYGVVYSCDQWAGHTPCAIKSVVPPDDKHWNDLALEFFYTKNIPDHDRVVMLRGSVIDYSYSGGTNPAVLLIMDRLDRDLYTAIKQHLDWVSRLQVSIDVVEGIRYLHSQGLVHRDIKLKNVLLDKDNRAKITDLGFCKPEAMMSGSIVGTPIHMAPELFTGRYDSSVDVYAFGILFWYICAGSVRLPQNFEQCANKDQLWTNVKRGLRPEELGVFDDECWELMSNCWEGEPIRRPLLGDVQLSLMKIYDRFKAKPGGPTKTARDSGMAKSSSRANINSRYKMAGGDRR